MNPASTASEPSQKAAAGLSHSAVAFWAMTVGAVAMLALAAVLAVVTRLPSDTSGTVLAVFPPRTPVQEVIAAIDQTQARIIRATLFSNAWIVESGEPEFVARLQDAGAFGAWKPVSGVSFAVGGCGFGAILSNDPVFETGQNATPS